MIQLAKINLSDKRSSGQFFFTNSKFLQISFFMRSLAEGRRNIARVAGGHSAQVGEVPWQVVHSRKRDSLR